MSRFALTQVLRTRLTRHAALCRIQHRVTPPQTDDRTWLKHLAYAPEFTPPTHHLMVIVPHPDDETLGAGGLIRSMASAGIPVSILAVTDGENAYDIPEDQRKALAEQRIAEQEAALSILSVQSDQILRLHLQDSGLHECTGELTEHLIAAVKPGMTLLAPWIGDFHPDHVACARAATHVAERMNLPLLSYFFWTWHRGTPDLINALPLRRFQLSPEQQAVKYNALSMHRSQLEWPDGEPILPEALLGPARWPFEVFLQS